MLTRDDFAEADRICSEAMEFALSDWDEKFVSDMADRLGRYGREARITPRQWEQLHRIEEQYL